VFEEASLVELAEEVGLDREEVRAVLAGDACADDVRREEAGTRERGVHAVPYVAAADDLAVVGAQSAEVYADLLARVGTRGLEGPYPSKPSVG
jgi:predicted DsbA family dithiol-disulfide isomerase